MISVVFELRPHIAQDGLHLLTSASLLLGPHTVLPSPGEGFDRKDLDHG